MMKPSAPELLFELMFARGLDVEVLPRFLELHKADL